MCQWTGTVITDRFALTLLLPLLTQIDPRRLDDQSPDCQVGQIRPFRIIADQRFLRALPGDTDPLTDLPTRQRWLNQQQFQDLHPTNPQIRWPATLERKLLKPNRSQLTQRSHAGSRQLLRSLGLDGLNTFLAELIGRKPYLLSQE